MASLSFLPTTPGNWVFHCHFAGHVGDIVTLHGSPDAFVVQSGGPNGSYRTAHWRLFCAGADRFELDYQRETAANLNLPTISISNAASTSAG